MARYQPNSLAGLELSPVVRTDFVPLMPDRTLTVDFSMDDVVTVTLDGLGPDGPEQTLVDVIIETPSGSSRATELVAMTGAPEAPAWVPVNRRRTVLGESLGLDPPAERPLRVRVREVELMFDTARTWSSTRASSWIASSSPTW